MNLHSSGLNLVRATERGQAASAGWRRFSSFAALLLDINRSYTKERGGEVPRNERGGGRIAPGTHASMLHDA